MSDFNPVTGQYVVRESNAHAWIEAEILPGEWRTFDGTPPQDFHELHQPDPTFWHSITKMYESLEFLWVRSVVAYDANSQKKIMGSPSTDFGLSNFGESLLNRFAAGRSRLIQRGAITAVIVFAASMFVGIILLRYKQIAQSAIDWIQDHLNHLWSRFFGHRKTTGDQRIDTLDRQIRSGLTKLGIPKPSWKPLKAHIEEHATMLDTQIVGGGEVFFEASEALYQLKFAKEPDPMDTQMLVDLGNRLRKSEKSPLNKR